MFEPLRDLQTAEKSVSNTRCDGTPFFIDDGNVLGEVGGRLYSVHDKEEYIQRGGVAYPSFRVANVSVVNCLARPTIRRTMHRLLETPLRLVQKSLHLATCVFPVLRIFIPTAVSKGKPSMQVAAAVHSGAERVVAIAFHPHRMVLAVAVHEGGYSNDSCRVCVYDVVENRRRAVLTHAFQIGVAALQWKPFSRDVLAVGCRGGVLLWSLSSAPSDGPVGDWGEKAYSVFYRCLRNAPTTTMCFSCRDGKYVACGSTAHTRMHLLDASHGPQDPQSTVTTITPSVEGGIRDVVFADDDTYILSTVSTAASVCLIRMSTTNYSTVTVATPGPVEGITKAPGIGVNYYFMYTKGLEGVVLARGNAHVGLEIISLISTGLCRGVGGAVRGITASKRRLWVSLETGHLLVCHYGCREGTFSLLPVGVAAMDVAHMFSFSGCTVGSMLAVADGEGTVDYLPSYHR